MASGVEKREAGPMVAASFRGNLGVVVSDSTGRALFWAAWGLLGLGRALRAPTAAVLLQY